LPQNMLSNILIFLLDKGIAWGQNQLHKLFPSSRELNMTWYSVVKLAESLYREAPGMDPYRPPQQTPVSNFFLAGSYTQQDYIDSMEGATLSGKQAAKAILSNAEALKAVAV
ncbi:MAG: FAD-dependent oxidoreductase, partial [Cyanobacteria bacterium J06555_3]